MSDEWTDCTSTFSNGTEFQIFLERCEKCTKYRAARCRIVAACYKAMYEEECFPFKDLQDHARYGGKRCRHFTTEIQHRKSKYDRQIPGQQKMSLEEMSFDELIRIGRKDGPGAATICWNCQKACGDCSWSGYEQHTPVPGWKATRVPLKMNGGYETTYVVHECPEFVPDGRNRGKIDKKRYETAKK